MRNISDTGRRKGYLSFIERMMSCFEGDIYAVVGLSEIEKARNDAESRRRPVGNTLAYLEVPDVIIEPVYVENESGCFSLSDDTVPGGVNVLWSRMPHESCADYMEIPELSGSRRLMLRDVFLRLLKGREMPRILDISRYSEGESPPKRILRLFE